MSKQEKQSRAAEKQKFAQDQHYVDCMKPSKVPLAPWLNDPRLLPKKPPIAKK